MFTWNSIWTMFMWNSSRLFVPCNSFEIMKSKGNGFWYQTWEANFNSQDFSVWLLRRKNTAHTKDSRYEKSLLLLPEPVTLVSSHPRIWKCAECWRLFPISWQSKPLVPALSHCFQSFHMRWKLLMISECSACTVIKQTLASSTVMPSMGPSYGALLCLLSQHVLERDLFANKLAKGKCAQ